MKKSRSTEERMVGANARVASTDFAISERCGSRWKRSCAAGRSLMNELNRKWPFARDTGLKATVTAASAFVQPTGRRLDQAAASPAAPPAREHASFNECRMPDDVRVVPLCRAASSRGASFSAQQPIYAIRRAA